MQASPSFAIQSKETLDLENEVRYWAYETVIDLLTYDNNNFDKVFEENEKYLTQKGCKKFRWILNTYGLSDDVVKRGEALSVVKLWRRRPTTKDIMLVYLKKIDRKDLKRRDLSPDTSAWIIEVPIILNFQKHLRSSKYRFIAHFEAKLISTNPNKFIITNWFLQNSKGVIKIDRRRKFEKHKYKECNDNIYQDMD